MNVLKLKTTKRVKKTAKYKKPPNAPKRFKTAYISFSTFMHSEIRKQKEQEAKNGKQQNSKQMKTPNVAKTISQAWKDLTPNEREKWDDMARKDKARWDIEKKMYGGPWKVTAKECRKMKKDPEAPKRPMSSYLAFANAKRADIKRQYPEMDNTKISRKLADMWKEASDEEKKEYIEEEYELRQKYLVSIAEFNKKKKAEEDAKRTEREEYASSIATQLESGTATMQQILVQNINQENNNIVAAKARAFGELVEPQVDGEGVMPMQQQQQQQQHHHLLQTNSANASGRNIMATSSCLSPLGPMMQNHGNAVAVANYPKHEQPASLLASHYQPNISQATQKNQWLAPSACTRSTASIETPAVTAPQDVNSNNFFQSYLSAPQAVPYQNTYQTCNVQQMHQQAVQSSGGHYEAKAFEYCSQQGNGTTTFPMPLNTGNLSYSDIWNGRYVMPN